MENPRLSRLKKAFEVFEAAQVSKEASDIATPLRETIAELEEAGYTRADIALASKVDVITVDRWAEGKGGMKPVTFQSFRTLVLGELAGHPQRAINVSNTGFVTWRYVFEHRQCMAERIWYLSSGTFLVSQSEAVRRVVKNLFSITQQEADGRAQPVLIYLYPNNSETEANLRAWKNLLIGDEYRGTVIGIGVKDMQTFPWFLPGVRAIMLEFADRPDREKLEGYIRVRMPDEAKDELLSALATPESASDDTAQVPWLRVHREVVWKWYPLCQAQFLREVERLQQKQADEELRFHTFFVTLGLNEKGEHAFVEQS